MELVGVLDAPAQMTMRERLLLFALVMARRPTRVLEIGTCDGGSALIMRRALEASARLVSVDPMPRWSAEVRDALGPNTMLVTTASPDGVAEAAALASGPFDFVLIDGDHTADGVETDIVAVVPHLADGAVLVFHDAHYWRVREGIERGLRNDARLVDAGMVSVEETPQGTMEEGQPVIWGGLRLLRYGSGGQPS